MTAMTPLFFAGFGFAEDESGEECGEWDGEDDTDGADEGAGDFFGKEFVVDDGSEGLGMVEEEQE